MARESGRRSESRCMTPFLLKPIICATSLKPFVHLPKEKPARRRAGFSPGKLEDRLETKNWADTHGQAGNIITARTCRPIFSNKEESLCSTRVCSTLIKHAAVGKSRYLGHTIFFRTIFPLEGLLLGALGGGPGIAGCPVGGGDDLGVAEQEQLVRGSRHSSVRIGSVDVVRQLLDGLHFRLEV